APSPIFSNVQVLLGFDGVNGATSETDQSSYGRAVTFDGNSKLDSGQSRFGSTALILDGTGDFISVPDSAELSVGTGDFCVEAWVWIPSVKSGRSTISDKRAGTGAAEHTLLLIDGVPAFDLFNSSPVVSLVA